MIAALTGGVGCGKSTVAANFAEMGWQVLNADAVTRDFYDRNDPAVTTPMVARWGREIMGPDGRIDRRKVADRVFAAAAELAWLNQLFHPLVRQVLTAAAEKIQHRDLLCEVPLLFEAGWETDFETVIAVWTSPELQRQRLRQRGWDDVEIERRIAGQWSADRKLEAADYGLINLYDRDSLQQQCMELNTIIKGKSWTK